MSPVHDPMTKARNSTSGRNTPLGPRVRDSKKAARTNGSIKKALKPTLGSLGNKGKDNIRPEVTSLAKESINKGDVFNSVQTHSFKGKELSFEELRSLMMLKEGVRDLARESPGSESINTAGTGSSLINVIQNGDAKDTNPVGEAAVVKQQGELLSEQKTKIQSQ